MSGRATTVRALLLGALVGASGCVAEVGPTSVSTELRAPVRVGFEGVADGLQPSCGTLDCHGQAGRNLRLFGERGLRLAADENPGEGATTPAEYEANYWSLVALEPEALSSVLAAAGANPERLILIRKGRGTTRHKGGAQAPENGPLDQCVVGWLRGAIPTEACRTAAKRTVPALP